MSHLPPPGALFKSMILIAADADRREELAAAFARAGVDLHAADSLQGALDGGSPGGQALIVVDFVRGGRDAVAACRELYRHGLDASLLGVFDEASLAALTPQLSLDEALVEPFGRDEVRGRLALLAWRRMRLSGEGTITVGDVVIDPVRHLVAERGRPVHLTAKEYELLRFFATNRGVALSRPRLLESVWGPEYLGGHRTVDVHVRRLRSKLGSLDELLQTVHGVGYRLRE